MNNLIFIHKETGEIYTCFFDYQFHSHQNDVDILHPRELLFYENLHEKRKKTFLSGRYLIKDLLQGVVPTKPNLIEIRKGIFDQPVIYHPKYYDWECSLSHTSSNITAIIFPKELVIGIDLEGNQEEMALKTKGQITFQEKMLCISNGIELFELRLWSAKEALSKCIKTGLTVPFQLLEINEISKRNGYLEILFKNFPQYKVLSFLIQDECLSFCIPVQLSIDKKIALLLNSAILK
ncbi:4'-phosphopantetheinyl transferase family protein [Flammeovirga pacifica]|uniref:4'-phosphopantetheinyl transferase domain-containing protein n=1 Tax=Flammeovirga pacifica TaxID=915059 RepID=A0A1S1Z454_FLAPC|nr:4'-phosphopantetheinyl transferase superfamily protein [Flammeovirga pacifica]OHX68066.1 hypothetical protein NH26_17805 [Flammeovirga pacifica]